MNKPKLLLIAGLITFSGISIKAQKAGPFNVNNSVEFTSPKKHKVSDPIGYGKDGIIQVNMKGVESFNFQQFSTDLKLEKENTVSTEGKLNDHVNYERMAKLKNKTYLFLRDVDREAKTEGISALEFIPGSLDFVGKSTPLFQSSDKVRTGGGFGFSFGVSSSNAIINSGPSGISGASSYGYNFVPSVDKGKFLYTYSLVPKEKKDALNKDIIGMWVFDENLAKLWGGEYEMPYTEAKMDNLGYTIGSDGKVYLLAKVYESDRPKETKDKSKKIPNFHFEVLVYDKGAKSPKIVELKLDNYFPKEAYIYEDKKSNIVIAGFYGKAANKPVDGAYMVKLDVEKSTVSKINGGYYEIPTEIIKAFTSDREKRKLDKKAEKDEDNDIGIDHLKIYNIYDMENGSTVIVSEQYYVYEVYYYDSSCKCMKKKYETNADDIFVISIDASGKLGWVRKVPKAQHANDGEGIGISINAFVTGNDVHIFYLDNIKNMNLPENQAPKVALNRMGGFLTGVNIDAKGDVKKYNLGDTKTFKTNFFIRNFVDGGSKNLISTERRKKKNLLFSITSK